MGKRAIVYMTVSIDGRDYALSIGRDFTFVDGKMPSLKTRFIIDTAARMIYAALGGKR